MNDDWETSGPDELPAYGPLALAGMIVDACAEQGRLFWSYWGPLGESAISVVESIADIQRRYLALLARSLDAAGLNG
jgi:hypothetical protein